MKTEELKGIGLNYEQIAAVFKLKWHLNCLNV